MSENLENIENQNTVPTPEEVLVDMRQNYVPKSELENVQRKYNELFSQVANGFTPEEEEKPLTDEQKKQQFEENIRAFKECKEEGLCEQVKRSLAIDDYWMETHGESSYGKEDGEAMRQILSTAVERADGNDKVCAELISQQISGYMIDNNKGD